jgi:hypothetical protein
MRLLCLLFLLAVGAVAVIFVMQNEQAFSVQFLGRAWTAPAWGILGVAYGLGMLTGWSLVGLLRRSWARATERREVREPSQGR